MSFPTSDSSGAGNQSLLAYVDELRQFSAFHNVPAGEPADLQALCDRLTDDLSFLIEFQSMVRSILYRENFRVTFAELLSLIGRTWGGPGTPDLNGELHPPFCDLASFLHDAMKVPRFEEPESSDGEEFPEAFTFPQEHHHLVARQLNEPPSSALEATIAAPTPRSTAPSRAHGSTPWWAEPANPEGFTGPAQTPDFLQQTELVTSVETTPLTNDPWQTNSTFHQELQRFAQRRREL